MQAGSVSRSFTDRQRLLNKIWHWLQRGIYTTPRTGEGRGRGGVRDQLEPQVVEPLLADEIEFLLEDGDGGPAPGTGG